MMSPLFFVNQGITFQPDHFPIKAKEIRHSFFIAGPNFTGIIGEDGEEIWDSGKKGARDGYVLKNGNILICWADEVREYNKKKKVVFTYSRAEKTMELGTAVRLSNGNTMITESGSNPRIVEVNKKGEVLPISLYCSALYLQLNRLVEVYDMDSVKTKSGGISGISNNGFTKKDFMSRYTTGDKKKIWGNPYMREEFTKGEGKVRQLLTKASGKLEINLNIERDEAKALAEMIEYAGVSSFYFGKKGLAYVSDIRI